MAPKIIKNEYHAVGDTWWQPLLCVAHLLILMVNVRQFRIKARWGISVSFGLAYHFPDLHYIHENSAETLGLNTALC